MGKSYFSRLRNSFSLKVLFGSILTNLMFWGPSLQAMVLNNTIIVPVQTSGNFNTNAIDVEGLIPALGADKTDSNKNSPITTYSSTSGSYICQSNRVSGTIGILSSDDIEDGIDNVFKVNLPNNFTPEAYDVSMSYELYGLAGAWQATKSINNGMAYGGQSVTVTNTWTKVSEPLSAIQFHSGENNIYFNRRTEDYYQYKVRNLKVELIPHKKSSKGVSSITLQNVRGKLFISGTVRPDAFDEVELYGNRISLSQGVFEGVVENAPKDVEKTTVNFYSNGKKTYQEIVSVSKIEESSFDFSIIKLYENAEEYSYNGQNGISGAYAGACVNTYNIKADVLRGASIRVQGLKFKDLKGLNPDLENVTEGIYRAYRIKKNALADSIGVALHLKYDPKSIPDGYTAKDIRTFAFSPASLEWKALPVDSLDIDNQEIITTIYGGETDYINGVIKVPDSPETGSYTPTTISEMKYADPTASVVAIQPPSAGNTGTANTSFPLKLPTGRNGMQPPLQVSYSSEAGNGWMGIGWNLSASAITINTKWGAPLYGATETELYTLDGSELVLKVGSDYTNPHRQANISRTTERIFYMRKESGYQKIIRHGSSPSTYYWEVIDKSGTRTFYGGVSALDNTAVVKTTSGNIGHWAIKRVQDVYGNYIDYQYSKTNTTVVGSAVTAQQFYLSKIQYTRNTNGLANYYEVRFNRNAYTVGATGSTSRTDVVLSAKNGYFEVVKDLLTEASVWFINGTQENLIRTYRFDYEEKDFKKQQLIRISEYDSNNQLFYSNTMEYYTLQNQNNNQNIINATSTSWSGTTDNISYTLPSISGFTPSGSPLGTSNATGFSFGFRGGFGVGADIWKISKTVGGSYNYSSNSQTSKIALMDVNGDGLPDKLVDSGSGLFYRPNTGTGFGDKVNITGISEFSKTKSRTQGGGFDATFGPISAGKSWNKTKSETDSYFTDFNGDGLIDMVTGGRVKFNVGGYTFATSADPTPNPIISGSLSSSVLQELKLETLDELREQNPQFDHVSVWEAPYTGDVYTYGTATLVNKNNDAQSHTNTFRLTISKATAGQVANGALPIITYNLSTAGQSVSTINNNNSISVNKGDKLMFRIHNLQYGYGGNISWDPGVNYKSVPSPSSTSVIDQTMGPYNDENNKFVNYFNAKTEFMLNNDEATSLKDNTSSLTLNFNMQAYAAYAFSDDIRFTFKIYSVNQTTGDLIPFPSGSTGWYADYNHITGAFTKNFSAGLNSAFSISGLSASTKYAVVTYVESSSNIRWEDIRWKPILVGNSVDTYYPSVNYYNFDENVNQTRYWFTASQLPEPVISTTVPSDANTNFIVIDHNLFSQGNYSSLLTDANSPAVKINWVVKEKVGTALSKILHKAVIYVRKDSSGAIKFKTGPLSTSPDINMTTDTNYLRLIFSKQKVKDMRQAGSYIYTAFYVNNVEVANNADINVNLASGQTGYTYQSINLDRPFFSRKLGVFGSNYKGWNQFLYNGGVRLQHDANGDVLPNTTVTDYGTSVIDMSIFDFEGQSQQYEQYDENTPPEDLPSNDSAPRYAKYNCNNNTNTYLNSSIIGSAYTKNASAQQIATIGRFGEASLYDVYIDSNSILLGGGSVFSGLKQRSESKGSSISGGASYASGTRSEASSTVLNQYIDLNADRYPDFVTGGLIQYTNMLGGLTTTYTNDFKSGDESTDWTVGASIPTNAPSSTASANGKATGNKTNTNISSGINGSTGESFNSNQWVDVNGDGLTDKVRLQGNTVLVWLNTGYGFTSQITWFTGSTQYKSSTRSNASVGATFGFSKDFALGVGAATSTANMQTMLADINGDGLPELVVNDGGTYKYHLNRGDRFETTPVTFFSGSIDTDVSTSANIFGTFTFGFPIPLLFITLKATFTPSAGVNSTLSQKTATLQDINGDGFIDVVTKGSTSNNSSVSSRLSQINRLYLLKKVNTSLGGSWALEYERNGNTYELPQNKWVLSKVTTHDGFTGSAADTAFGPDITKTSFTYANPKYDRREREFLGFGTVTTKQLDPSSEAVFRSVVNYYHNENIYLSGLAKGTATYDSANQLLSEQSTLYNILNPDTPQVNLNAQSNGYMQTGLAPSLLDKSRLFVAMVRTTSSSYESGQALISIKTVQGYDTTGNITSYLDTGSSQEDSYKAVVEYQLASSFEQTTMTGFPKKISVYQDSNNQLMRQRSASYNAKGSMTQIITKLNATEDNTVVFGYDSYGNLNKVTENDNKNSTNTTSYVKNITYDPTIYTYPTGISNSFGETSSTTYNYLFGIPVYTTDKNAQSMRTRIDNRGRIVEVTGPNELALETSSNKTWTIRMQYKGEQALANNLDTAISMVNATGQFIAVNPGTTNPTNSQHYAVTRHFDPEFLTAGTINEMVTISIADGFGRAIQVKKTHKSGNDLKWLVSGFEQKDAYGRTLKTYLPAVQTPYPTTLGTYSATDTGYLAITPSSLQPPVEMTYDAKDRAVTVKQPGESQSAQISFAMENGMLVQSITNELNQTMQTYTDNRGRQRKTVQNGELTTTFEYNAINELKKVTDNQGAVTAYLYDLAGRKTEMQHPDRGIVLMKYDKAGRMIQQSNSNLQLNGGLMINYLYDYNRLTNINYPSNPENNVKYTYGLPGDQMAVTEKAIGRLLYQEDATGVQVFGYGRMGEVTKNLRSVAVAGYQSYWFYTSWKYDSWNRVQEITYPDQEKVSYNYNKAGMLESISSQIPGLSNIQNVVSSITYNDFGERSSLTNGNGVVTNYTYDTRRRLKTLIHAFTGMNINKQYGYDALSNIKTIATNSPQSSLPDPGEIGGPMNHSYDYDNYNRLVHAEGRYTGPSDTGVPYLQQDYSLNMEYNLDHTIKRKTQVHTQTVTATYGGGMGGESILKTNYDLQYSDYATGAFVAGPNSYGYQQPHAVRTITEAPAGVSGLAADDPQIRHKQILYDANGNQKEIKEKVGEMEISLRKNQWDEENRLIGVDLKPDQTSIHPIAVYTYNAGGERTIRYNIDRMDANSNAYRVGSDSRDNIMIYPSGLLMGKVKHVDAKGTIINRMTYTKHYYIGSERISAKTGTMTELGLYPYTPVTAELPQMNTTTIRGNSTLIVGKAKSLVTKTYNYFGQQPPVMTARTEEEQNNYTHDRNNPNIYYFHPDHLGSSSYITNETGRVSQHMEYMPFGETLVDEHINSFNSPFKFNGKEYDEETGNYYYSARYYDPKMSIFISVDPMAEKFPDISPYAYCLNNPIIITDPNGMEAIDPEKIKQAAANAVATVSASDKNGKLPAKCNIGVNLAFTELTGSHELDGLMANDMFDYMAKSDNFVAINAKDAQNAANNGEIVIPAWKADSGHGHVDMVVPGKASMSGTWERKPAKDIGGIPNVMDTGVNMRTESQPINKSFGKDKQSSVVFYKYVGPGNSSGGDSSNNNKPSPSSSSPTSELGSSLGGYKPSFISQGSPPKYSDELKSSKIPIFQTIGSIIGKLGF